MVFQPGQRLRFTTDSNLYRDVYDAEVLAVYPDRLDLQLSLHRGYLLLIPIGTIIRWQGIDSRYTLTSTVLARNTTKKSWSVTTPTSSTTHSTRVIAVGSGKGGVGKTTFSINLGLALSQFQQNVVLLDADIGMANIEVLLGLNSCLNLTNVIYGECTLRDILTPGPGGIHIIPGSSGISALTTLDTLQFNRIISGFGALEADCDFLIIDTGAGLSELVLNFLGAADEIILLTTPEPHALMDVYALTKTLRQRGLILPRLVVNRCDSPEEAHQTSQTFIKAANQFLGIETELLGWLPNDKAISRSLKEQKPIFLNNKNNNFCLKIEEIASKLLGIKPNFGNETGLRAFFRRFARGIS
ncbi:MAG: P-loop NTPase [Desulfitobacterium hafniense]|nr:P-loop NTPase [Desulfitobacterium hafniense]